MTASHAIDPANTDIANQPKTSTSDAAGAEWRNGARPLIASTVGYGCGVGMFTYVSGLFILPMQAESGLSASAVTISAITSMVVGLGSPFAGMMVDRWGSRKVAITGLTLFGACLLLLAAIPLDVRYLYAVAVMMGAAGALCSTTPFARCVAGWFRVRVGSALGLTMNGTPLVAFCVSPIISFVIYSYGWRAGFLTLAGIVFLFALPIVAWNMREAPIRTSRTTQGYFQGLSGSLRTPAFWLLSLSIGLASLAIGGFLAHLAPLLTSKGLPLSFVTGLVMLYAISIIIGRLGGGFLIDRFWDGGVAFVLLALSAVGAAFLAGLGGTAAIVIAIGILLVGMGQGVEADMIAYFAQKIFGMERYSAILGLWTLVSSVLIAIGGMTFARIYDITGSYISAIWLGAVCFLLAGIIMLVTRRFVSPEGAAETA